MKILNYFCTIFILLTVLTSYAIAGGGIGTGGGGNNAMMANIIDLNPALEDFKGKINIEDGKLIIDLDAIEDIRLKDGEVIFMPNDLNYTNSF